MTDPINNIKWRHATELKANHYNPNVVFSPELKLLEWSLLSTGWIQPVLANPNDIIIDGFHRWRLSTDSPQLMQRYGGLVPVAVVDCDDAHAMMMTVRFNRAKGSHVAVKMNGIVRQLLDDYHLTRDELVREMGMTQDEVDLLYQEDVFAARTSRRGNIQRLGIQLKHQEFQRDKLYNVTCKD